MLSLHNYKEKLPVIKVCFDKMFMSLYALIQHSIKKKVKNKKKIDVM